MTPAQALWNLLDQLDHAGIADWEGSEILDLQPAIKAVRWTPSSAPPWGVGTFPDTGTDGEEE